MTHNENGGGITTVTNASGVITSEFADLLGRPFKTISGATGLTQWGYYAPGTLGGWGGKLASMTDGDYVTSASGYNAKGQRTTTSRTVPLAIAPATATQVSTSVSDVVANVTLHGINLGTCQRQTQTIASTGVAAVTTLETFASIDGLTSGSLSFGRQTLVITTRPDASGISTRTTTYPDGTQTVEKFSSGLLSSVQKKSTTGGLVSHILYGHDALNRLYLSLDVSLGFTYYGVDEDNNSFITESGQYLLQLSPANQYSIFAYDIMGQEIYNNISTGSYKLTAYYPTGQVKASMGNPTYPTWNVYDEQGRQTQLHTWKVAPALDFAVLPPNPPAGSEVTTWIYGATTGRLNRKQYADTKGTDYNYTSAGRLASRTWARGVSTSYSYNQGFLTFTNYSDATPDVTIAYEPLGRQSTITQATQSRTTYTYDPANLALDTETVRYDIDRNGTFEFSRVIDRSRDAIQRDTGYLVGNAAASGVPGEISLPIEAQATYGYAADGRLSQVANPLVANQAFNYAYKANSNLVASVSGPIHTVSNTWMPNREQLDVKQNKVGGTVISSFDYQLDFMDRRDSVTTNGTAFPNLPKWTWGYDERSQIISADSNVAGYDRSYEYDAIGNRKKSADSLTLPVANNYTANSVNQYSQISNPQTLNPSYDFDGNATAYPLPITPDSNSTLAWDAENRLISSISVRGTTRYLYDSLSRRIAKIVGNTNSLYLYDSWNMIAQYERKINLSPDVILLKTQLWGMDLSGTMQGAGGVGGLLSIYSQPYGQPIAGGIPNINALEAATHYPTYDGNGNVSEYLSANGTIVGHFEYDPFGNALTDYASSTILFSHILDYRFSTKPRDSETGLYYYGYRYYDPATGRWLNRDPIEEKGGINLYGFVGNEPIWHIDVLGLKTRKPCPFEITAGHSGNPDEPGNVDSREKDFNKNGGKCDCGRFYGASCFRSSDGGLVWPTPESRDTDPRASPSNSTIGEETKRKIQQAEKDALEDCANKEKCCSNVKITVSCLPDFDNPSNGSMATARKKDSLAQRACNYSNTYICPDSKGAGGKWTGPLFK